MQNPAQTAELKDRTRRRISWLLDGSVTDLAKSWKRERLNLACAAKIYLFPDESSGTGGERKLSAESLQPHPTAFPVAVFNWNQTAKSFSPELF